MITKDEAIALIEARLQKQERVIVALDGMSCSGKSTFAKHINAILTPGDGTVYVDGKDTRKRENL